MRNSTGNPIYLRRAAHLARNLARWLFVLLLAAGFLKLLLYQWNVLRTPFQLEYREGAMLLSTGLLLRGENPYAPANQPLAVNEYGLVYNLLVLPFAALFGNTLAVHRALSAACILSCAGLLLAWLRREALAWRWSAAGGLLVWANLLFQTTPVARPDSLGTLLFLLALLVPAWRRFDRPGLALSLVFGLLAYFTKIYFVLAIPLVAGYLFLAGRRRAALGYTAAASLLWLVAAVLVNGVCPYYFHNTLYLHLVTPFSGAAASDYLIYQTVYYLGAYWPLALLGFMIALSAYMATRNQSVKVKLSLPGFLLNPDYTFYLLGMVSLALLASLGRNTGNFMAYYFQLLTPFVAAAGLRAAARAPRLEWFSLPLVIACLAFNLNFLGLNLLDLNYSPAALPNAPEPCQAGWEAARRLVAGRDPLFAPPALSELLLAQNVELTDTGHNEYFRYGVDTLPSLPFLPTPQDVKKRWTAFTQAVEQKVTAGQYSQVILTRDYTIFLRPEQLSPNYHYDHSLVVCMPQTRQEWTLDVWLP